MQFERIRKPLTIYMPEELVKELVKRLIKMENWEGKEI